jgi:hypothetical protein
MAVGAGVDQGGALLADWPAGELLADADVLGAGLRHVAVALGGAEQPRHHAHRARGVEHVGGGAPAVAGSIFTAVCVLLVVAPPISSGHGEARRSISRATKLISSSDGVIRPLRPIMSTLCFCASSRMRSAGTMTPRSMTS